MLIESSLMLLDSSETLPFACLSCSLLLFTIAPILCPQEVGQPHFSMVCEKCAFEGTTRFEDGLRLPLGISVNFPSFAAGILTEVSIICKS